MKPGRELDVLVAEKVMGLADARVEGTLGAVYDFTGAQGMPRKHVPCYSTEIAAAWEVVEKLAMKGRKVEVVAYQSKIGSDIQANFRVTIGTIEEYGPAPHAICLAALKAVGVEI